MSSTHSVAPALDLRDLRRRFGAKLAVDGVSFHVDRGEIVGLVGVFYPLGTLPLWMRVIGYALPPSYVFESMRAVVAGAGASLAGLAIAAALAIGDLLLAGWSFSRTHRHALRSGLIARYSAETVM